LTEPVNVNPFTAWVQIARDFQDAILNQLAGTTLTPRMGEIMGRIAAVITRLEHLAWSFNQLAEHEPENWEAIQRAMGANREGE
jgi:hypothetical protein